MVIGLSPWEGLNKGTSPVARKALEVPKKRFCCGTYSCHPETSKMSTSSNNSEDAVNKGLRYKREGDLAHILTCT